MRRAFGMGSLNRGISSRHIAALKQKALNRVSTDPTACDRGRALCFLLSMFSLGVFGYITAALASFFVNKESVAKPTRAREETVLALREEVRKLRKELQKDGPR